MTSTLFTSTLAIAFLVVGLPHILPCPVDRRQFTDADGKMQRRRRRRVEDTEETETGDETSRSPRECPVPKPGVVMGQMMGLEQRERPVQVVVQDLKGRAIRKEERNDGGNEGPS